VPLSRTFARTSVRQVSLDDGLFQDVRDQLVTNEGPGSRIPGERDGSPGATVNPSLESCLWAAGSVTSKQKKKKKKKKKIISTAANSNTATRIDPVTATSRTCG